MNYEEFAQLPRSQKITLAVIKAKQRLKNFTFISGSTWTRVTPFYVSNVTGATYSFNPINSTLTLTSLVNPNTLEIVVEYSFFFSDFPVNQDVEYQPRLTDIGALKLELDTENTGIAIESDSSIKLENTDGYFDGIYDTLTWENQLCEFYSWSPLIAWADRRLIYKGYINTKSFNEKYISFNLKDTFIKLREKIPFTGSRLIYGKVKNLDCTSLDKVGEGFTLSSPVSGRNDRDLLSGAISGTVATNTIAGLGTLFTTQLAVGDKIRAVVGLNEYSYTVNTIASNTSLTISGTISVTFAGAVGRNSNKLNNIITGDFFTDEVSPGDKLTIEGVEYSVNSIEAYNSLTTSEQIKTAFTSVACTNLPSINYRFKNRTWDIAGHLLGSHSTYVDTVISPRIFTVVDPGHIVAGDVVELVTYHYTVERISGNMIFLNQDVLSGISSFSVLIKPAIQKVTLNGVEFVHGRDFTELNDVDSCKIIFDDNAEFNVATEQIAGVSLVFTNASRTVTSLSPVLDLTTILGTRDFILPGNGFGLWYEILSVDQTTITLRNNYTSPTYTGPAIYRKPDFIGDASPVLVGCMGKKDSTGKWLKTAADAVKDIITQINITNIDSVSFESANEDANYTLSLVLPGSIGSAMPIVRDTIALINKSVLGSIYSDADFNIAYSVLNSDRDETISTITDHDIVSFTTSTKNQIVGTVTSKYCHEIGTDSNSTYSFSNNNAAGINSELALDLYLYDQADAVVVTQRYAFFRSLSQTTVNIKGRLYLVTKSLNDRVYLKLNRLFKRFGSSGKIKVGLINMISKDSSEVNIQINDVGNIFSRVGSIAPNTITDYITSTDEDIARYGYIVDSDSETVDASTDISLGTNLIG